MPQRTSLIDGSNPFGSSLFSSGWNTPRDRSSTLASVRSADNPESPAQLSFAKDGLGDGDVKTLDYLGLAETPRQGQANMAQPALQRMSLQPFFNDLTGMNRNLNRLRSFSVNAKEKYTDEEEEDYMQNGNYSGQQSGAMTPMDIALAQTKAQIHHHNLAVQAFATQASASRPRARTAGVLDSPLRTNTGALRFISRPQQMNSPVPSSMDWSEDYEGLPEAVQALNLNTIGRRATLETYDENSQERPTRALWLGNIPTSTTTSSLEAMFGIHGKIESCRVLMHKNCGFVNFESIESARNAKISFNGKEIFPGAGPVKIGYAKAPSTGVGTPGNQFPSRSPDPYSNAQSDNQASHVGGEGSASSQLLANKELKGSSAAPHVPSLSEAQPEMLKMANEFGASADDRYSIEDSINTSIAFQDFNDEIAPINEPGHTRLYDAPKLRDIRKRIDNNAMTTAEIEETAIGMLPEIAELASDYLGNTVVQKLFEFCSEEIKEQMLQHIAPHLAQIGVHKNGTWAAQKIIDVAKLPNQIDLVVRSLRPYTVPLFLDQYGNYVLQGCLRFGFPHNNFIFETMLSRMWDIAQGRFGARAMRACLESHHATKSQQRMLAAAIALHSVQLATNANGALLLTWFLDTCNLPNRRSALAPRLVPHLVHLCTHKVAYLTVLKVINQRNEIAARDIVLDALFAEDEVVLEEILSDQQCGATLIFKVLTTPCFDEPKRNEVLNRVRNVLQRLKVSASQGYKRLMDEVGLIKGGKPDRDLHTPNGQHPHQERPRSTPQHAPRDGRRHQQMDNDRQYGPQFYQPAPQQGFPMQTGFSNSSGLESNPLLSYSQLEPNFQTAPLGNLSQYQQNLLSRGNVPSDVYSGVGLNGYGSPSPVLGQLPNRPIPMSTSPMMQQGAFNPPNFNPLMAGNGIGNYQFPMQYYPQQQQVMQPQDSGRRGRVSQPSTLTYTLL